jgi:hypothetical protein
MNEQPETLLAAVRYFADLEICNAYMRPFIGQLGNCGFDESSKSVPSVSVLTQGE